jgi:signal transduction histidine kinase
VTEPSPEWLARANRLALEARLMSGAVHDVNNLLQIISGNAELLESAAAASEATLKRGRSIGANARRASGILAEVLAFARETSGGVERVDLRQMATRALALCQAALGNARIDAAVDPGPATVARADPRAVLHIVLNLIVNAEQTLSGRRGGRIRLRCVARDDVVELIVEDNGPGLPPDVQARLLEGAVDAASVRLGLGLAVSQTLARLQGGTLSHAQPPGGGCSMTLTLPRAD